MGDITESDYARSEWKHNLGKGNIQTENSNNVKQKIWNRKLGP